MSTKKSQAAKKKQKLEDELFNARFVALPQVVVTADDPDLPVVIPYQVFRTTVYSGPSITAANHYYKKMLADGRHPVTEKKTIQVNLESDDLEKILPKPVYMFINCENIGIETPDNYEAAKELADVFPEFAQVPPYFQAKNKRQLEAQGIDTTGLHIE